MPILEAGCEILDIICETLQIDSNKVVSLRLDIEIDEQPRLEIRLNTDVEDIKIINQAIAKRIHEGKLAIEVKAAINSDPLSKYQNDKALQDLQNKIGFSR